MITPEALNKKRGKVRSLLQLQRQRLPVPLIWVGAVGGGEKGSDSGPELKADPAGLADGFDVSSEKEEESVLLRGSWLAQLDLASPRTSYSQFPELLPKCWAFML